MDRSYHSYFGNFAFGFHHLGGERYEVIDFNMHVRYWALLPEGENGKKIVEFQYPSGTSDAEKIPPKLLNVHLALGYVMHATGAGEAEWDDDDDDENYVEGVTEN